MDSISCQRFSGSELVKSGSKSSHSPALVTLPSLTSCTSLPRQYDTWSPLPELVSQSGIFDNMDTWRPFQRKIRFVHSSKKGGLKWRTGTGEASEESLNSERAEHFWFDGDCWDEVERQAKIDLKWRTYQSRNFMSSKFLAVVKQSLHLVHRLESRFEVHLAQFNASIPYSVLTFNDAAWSKFIEPRMFIEHRREWSFLHIHSSQGTSQQIWTHPLKWASLMLSEVRFGSNYMYEGGNSTTVEEISDSSVSLLICSWLMPGRASGHQKLAPSPMDRHCLSIVQCYLVDNYLMVTGRRR